MISVSFIWHYCDNRLEFYRELLFSLLSQKDMHMETERNYLPSLKCTEQIINFIDNLYLRKESLKNVG
jgi:hypothetical protein